MLAPGTARRRALDEALAEIETGEDDALVQWKVRFALMLGLERVLRETPPHLASGTELRRHQVDALAGMLTELIAATPGRAGGRTATARSAAEELEPEEDEDEGVRRRGGRRGELELPRRSTPGPKDPGAGPPLPLPPPDRVRQDDRGGRLRRGGAHARRPDPHPPPPARHAVPARADRRGLRRAVRGRDPQNGQTPPRANPITIQTYAWFARHVGGDLAATRTSS